MSDENREIPELLYRFRPLEVAKNNGSIANSDIPKDDWDKVAHLFIDPIDDPKVDTLRFKSNISADIALLNISSALKNLLLQAYKPEPMIKSVVKELENQEIYFSSNEELNDPMEGWQREYFEGDEVIWTNFLNNYLLNFIINSVNMLLAGNSKEFVLSKEILFLRTKSNLQEKPKMLYEELVASTFKSARIKLLLDTLIIRRKLYKPELIMIFNLCRKAFLNEINNVVNKTDGFPLFPYYNENPQEIKTFEAIFNAIQQNKVNGLEAINRIETDLFLAFLHDHKNDSANNKTLKDNNVNYVMNYTGNFFDKFAQSIHPEYGISSFSKVNDDSSMWGHYADAHKGICLIFKSKEPEIHMTDTTKLKFYKVIYNDTPPEIDVFSNLGTFTMKEIDDDWATADGKTSTRFNGYGEEEFRKIYWDNFVKRATFKCLDWKYEEEYRLISNRLFLGDKVHKLQKYNFSMLSGIIFGVNTPIRTKLDIIRVIEQKCREYKRGNFVFHQAEFMQDKSKMQIRAINSIRFN